MFSQILTELLWQKSQNFNFYYIAMWEIQPWCEKYDKIEECWLNMLLAKETSEIIVRVNGLIRKCLSCKTFKQWCTKSEALVDFLAENDIE